MSPMTSTPAPPVPPTTGGGLFTVYAETATGDVPLESCCCLHSARAVVDQLLRRQAGDWVITGPDAAGVVGPRGWASSSGPTGDGDMLTFW
jgi:hypothetical protein